MPLDYKIAERTLANGLRVIVSEDHSVPNVTVNLWVNVGSRHEVEGRTGFAHLFEHLMFQGSASVASGEHFSALMSVGGRLNATTWFDRTNYFETVPRGAMDLALWMEADRHGRLLDVVKEEKRQRYDNLPYGNALIDIYAAIFPKGHPYHHATIGSMADLDTASVQDVHDFFRCHYGPNNTVLALVGDLTPDEGFAAAQRYFGPLPATASSSVEVPDLDSAARAVRKAASFAAGSVTIRAGTRQDAIAARTASLSRGTAGTTPSSAPTRSAPSATASPNPPAIRRISPARLPGSTSSSGGSESRRRASSALGRILATRSLSGCPTNVQGGPPSRCIAAGSNGRSAST